MHEKEKWIPIKAWREEIESRRNEVKLAIKYLTRALLSGEDLTECRIGQQIVEIGRAIDACGVTDQIICEAVEEARRETGVPENDDIGTKERFSNVVPWIGTVHHTTDIDEPPQLGLHHDDEVDESPELAALRIKRLSSSRGGIATAALKLASNSSSNPRP